MYKNELLSIQQTKKIAKSKRKLKEKAAEHCLKNKDNIKEK